MSKTISSPSPNEAALCLLTSAVLLVAKGSYDPFARALGPAWITFVIVPLPLMVYCLRIAKDSKLSYERLLADSAAMVCIASALCTIYFYVMESKSFPWLAFSLIALAWILGALFYRRWLIVALAVSGIVWFALPLFPSPGAELPRIARDGEVTLKLTQLAIPNTAGEPQYVFQLAGLDEGQLRDLGGGQIRVAADSGSLVPVKTERCKSLNRLLLADSFANESTFVGGIDLSRWIRAVDLTIFVPVPPKQDSLGRPVGSSKKYEFHFNRVPVGRTDSSILQVVPNGT